MAVAVSKPTPADRADDVRSLKFRFRRLTFSGNYATGGETVNARDVGLRRVAGVVPLSGLTRAAAGVTGNLPVIDVATNGTSFVVRQLEDAAGAAGTAVGQEKTNAEAYIASQFLDVVVLGY
jgi:hypothetical protein